MKTSRRNHIKNNRMNYAKANYTALMKFSNKLTGQK